MRTNISSRHSVARRPAPTALFARNTDSLELPVIRRQPVTRTIPAIEGGCVSALSVPYVQRGEFKEAVVAFAQLKQSALPAAISVVAVPEAFASMADIEAAAEVIDALPRRQAVDSDEIEACGYMGWLG